MTARPSEVSELLRRCHLGDRDSLSTLVQRHLPEIRNLVHHRLGPGLRRVGDTEDFLQDAMVEVLRYAPAFLVDSDRHFCLLMARIIENVLCNRHDHFAARRRELARECPLPSESALRLDASLPADTRPSEVAARREREAWVRLGLELLSSEDRDVIVLHGFDNLPFAEIANRLGIAEGAAKMRYHRALSRLGVVVGRLRRGEIDELGELAS